METSSASMRVCGIGIRTDWPRHTLTGRSISCSKKSPTSLPVAALLIAGGAAADAGRIVELTAAAEQHDSRSDRRARGAGTRDPGVSRCARARVVGSVRFCLRSHHVICQNVSTAPVKPGSAPIKNGALPVSERRVIVLAGFHAKTREGFLDPHYVAKSAMICGTAVSNPTTSNIPPSFGSAMLKPFETMPTTISLAGIPVRSRY